MPYNELTDIIEAMNGYPDPVGSVTSVELTVPVGFLVSGSPITDAGTLAVTQVSLSVRVYNDANESIADPSLTALTFNQERWDSDTMHSTSVNSSRLTATTAGLYDIGGNVVFANGAGTARGLFIRVGGSNYIAGQYVPPVGGGGVTTLNVSSQWSLAAAEYVELVVSQDSGGALNVTSVSASTPEFWMTRLGPQP